jgi:hypothetical protein
MLASKETFTDDFHHILSDLNLSMPEENIHVYKSKKPLLKEQLSDKIIAKIESRVK